MFGPLRCFYVLRVFFGVLFFSARFFRSFRHGCSNSAGLRFLGHLLLTVRGRPNSAKSVREESPRGKARSSELKNAFWRENTRIRPRVEKKRPGESKHEFERINMLGTRHRLCVRTGFCPIPSSVIFKAHNNRCRI